MAGGATVGFVDDWLPLALIPAVEEARLPEFPAPEEAKWSSRGAEFLTPPIDRGQEIRCYLRDPDGHLIEVGQAKLRV